MTPARFPHSDTPGSTLGCQLPRAYRRLLRPSSALDAKASTTCPSQLVTHTTNPTHPHQPENQPTKRRTRQAMHTCHSHKETTRVGQSTDTRNKQTKQQNRQPLPGTRHSPGATEKEEPSRCSRPLSRSQTTTPHHPTHATHAAGMARQETPHTRTTRPTAVDAGLIPQNPNSVSVSDAPSLSPEL